MKREVREEKQKEEVGDKDKTENKTEGEDKKQR